ncbi:glutamate synthase large subunit [Magnetospirillum moscoviense]|uniref:Glutamate synthase [NADPH] large chain n=1 Tax=Magnetospirillum moscoviense TaxID=1437059 RepID=A0A178M9M4_9PROT|nr:glutamate synthase large subunit [Magnetospirillum moscoviense]OAN45460.1 glutamate synthase subunit alpha [Magnetospirillum moscoviense]
MSGLPDSQGLYDPRYEHDACGVGFIADIKNRKSHDIVVQGLEILKNLTHRGAVGADPLAGDGAGILIQMPDAFLRAEAARAGITLPDLGLYGAGTVFLPQDPTLRRACEMMVERLIVTEGQVLLGWRDVPTDNTGLGETVKPTEPFVRMVFIGRGARVTDQQDFERRLFIIRKQAENRVPHGAEKDFYIPSLSTRTLVYKGMLLADQVGTYYKDLSDKRMVSAMALVHQRFSTNTFPSWRLAHPFRMVCHNGEINTLRGNVNWMNARRGAMNSEVLGEELAKLFPLIAEGQSDTACFDNALELLVLGGYSLPHAMMMLIPEAWSGNPLMDDRRRAFYEYHAALLEPWDGPAAVCFTDGRMIGATLDRNGLRPARYLITDDDKILLASEMGVLPFPEDKIVKKWRLQPGKMLLIDLEAGRLIDDSEIKEQLASAKPYQAWLNKSQMILEELSIPVEPKGFDADTLLDRQQVFGYTQEDLKFLMQPMAVTGQEAIGSMGTDTPLAVLSDRPKPLFNYFKQCFAQVTNPPIDSIREESVMSLVSLIGPRPNLLGVHHGAEGKRLEVKQPILTNEDLEKIRRIEQVDGAGFKSIDLDITWPATAGAAGMEKAIDALCREAQSRVIEGFNILVLSDRKVGADRIPVPSLLAVSAVHHHLIREGLRTQVGLVIETGEAREVHHMCCLAGYGAEAINPYLAFETLESMRPTLPEPLSSQEVQKRFIKGMDKAILKVMAKMGISTYQSYCGAQIFDALGLAQDFVDKYFAGTGSRVGGVGLAEVAEGAVRRHKLAYSDAPVYRDALDVGGEYAWRNRGEDHAWTSESIAAMQHAVRTNSFDKFKEFSTLIDDQSRRLLTLRGLFEIKPQGNGIPLDEVEPAKEIVKRFVTGAMSFGSISREAHTTLAIAMNRIGGKSNTGEGGEEAERFLPMANGDSMRSAIKQVASGRFGVTAEYLVNADDIQIKMAQGAKPGEGGQLPGHKVDQNIARVRHSTPGVGLISPPPHHDIYSIEDLAQLIFDLKNVNPEARISVKLVSEIGVGTVAAGVSKAKADHVTISGFDGGTGASPLTSIKHAGSPWEIGLAETHQTLVLNGLRKRIVVQVDGALRTGRDVVIGALLGADEFGFATAPLIAAGCIMMRKCHLNTCPVGVATQDPELRKRFNGQPEHVINYFFFIAEEVRQLMAALGFRKLEQMIGRADLLDSRKAVDHWKAKGLDFGRLFHVVDAKGQPVHHCENQEHDVDAVLDRTLIAEAQPAIKDRKPVRIVRTIKNVDRSAGAMLSGAVAKVHGHAGLPDDSIHVRLTGTAGQSFGAFVARGVTMELEGEGNDYVGKGLSGGRLIIYPPKNSKLVAEDNIIVGNTVLYGAIEGECYFRGVGGERFAVRNSGAIAVVEGVGDHGCEYMTGGCVLVIGPTGRNFAAGMSGGVAYVLDEAGDFKRRCNLAMVDLEPVVAEEDAMAKHEGMTNDLESHGLVELMGDMTKDDATRILALLHNHQRHTGSKRAHDILLNWEYYMPKFVKVMPVDYRRALMEMQKANEPKQVVGGGR